MVELTWLVFLCLHYLVLVDRQVRSALVMAPPRVHAPPTHHALQASTAEPGLRLCDVIHKAYDPVHLPPALVPGTEVYQ